MKRGLLCIFVLFSILLMVSVSAIDTEIKIKTKPFHEVQVAVAKPVSASFESWANFRNYSDQYGDVNFTFSSDKEVFDLIVYIKKDNEKIMPRQTFYENFPAGDPIYLKIAPEGFEFIETPEEEIEELNETVELNETESQMNETESQITGAVIFGEGGIFSKRVTYYIMGGVLLLGVAAFIFLKFKKRSKKPKDIKVTKLSELQAEKKEKIGNQQSVIEDAEKKIKEAQEDIRKIKNEDKIKEAKQKLMEDEKELMRLREGKE